MDTSSPKKTEKRSLESSSSNSKELQSVFNYLDKNGDGKISTTELQSYMRKVGRELSMEEAKDAIKSSDLNGDGVLDLHEFQKLMERTGSDEELREAFKLYEMEGLGCITPASLKRMLNRLGESRSINDCKAMIHAFDLNGDGVLTFDEFAIMMR